MRERELLEHIFRSNARLPASVVVPPGDDLAAIRLDRGDAILVGVDQLIDGRHVLLNRVGPEAAGRKAICRSVSDVAAMVARPLCSLATAALPSEMDESIAMRLFDAMRETADRVGAPIVGGDIAISAGPLVVTVTVLALPGEAGIVERRGARVGDGVYVTGELGAAWTSDGGGPHLSFTPRVAEAAALAQALGPALHACIDISDGLGIDAARMATCSGVDVDIDASLIPCRRAGDWRGALGDGEDYELLFAAEGPVPDRVVGCRVTRIGEIVRRTQGIHRVRVRTEHGVVEGDSLGWEHRA